jgi:hypothetical protein
MKSATLLLAAMIMILLAYPVIVSVNEFRSREYTEPHIVVTDGASTTAPVVLVNDLFGDTTANAEVVSSDVDDAPYPSAYVPGTNTLTVAGLAISTTRTLTVTYRIAALTDYPGADLMARFWPIFLILGIFGLIGGAIYNATRKGD